MSTIRRQSIISSVIVYLGFGLGALNTFLYGRLLDPAQYGLVGMFVSIGSIMFAFANLGALSYITKFFPYYHDNLPPRRNDLLNWALLISIFGFMLVTGAGILFKPLIIRKFAHNSAELVHYYYWIFPFGFGLTLFSVLEAYGWQIKASVLTNYLREFQWRLYSLILIGLLVIGVLGNFDLFVKLYAFSYLFVALILFIYVARKGQLHLTFSPSRVTRKFLPKIRQLIALAWTGNVMFNLSFYFAHLAIAAVVPGGLSAVGIFSMALYVASLIQAPQRGVIAAAVGPLSRAWKDKDLERIRRIYTRSSVNLLIFSVGMFVLIVLNFRDGILTFGLKKEYLMSLPIFWIIGITRIVDMGTGLNTQIIGTSVYWRFDFITGIILITFTIPLNYLLARRFGVIGPAIADLITFSLYNGIRCLFLYRRFGMQPFTMRSLLVIVLGAAIYLLCKWLFGGYQGIIWILIRSVAIVTLFGAGVIALKLSEDVLPVWATVKKRLRINS